MYLTFLIPTFHPVSPPKLKFQNTTPIRFFGYNDIQTGVDRIAFFSYSLFEPAAQ